VREVVLKEVGKQEWDELVWREAGEALGKPV
jgi:hypothetical protein